MRIAILGNSHTACLKYALDDAPDLAGGHEIVFFASPASGMADLVVEGRTLVARSPAVQGHLRQTSGGDGVFDPAAFDAAVIFALQFRVPRLDRYLSSAVRRAATLNAARTSLGWRLSRKINRLAPGLPLFMVPQPLPVGAGEGADRRVPYEAAMAPLRALCERGGVRLIEQPPETRGAAATTQAAFGKGSRRLLRDTPHGEEDEGHMNAAFGQIMLRHVLDVVQSAAVAP